MGITINITEGGSAVPPTPGASMTAGHVAIDAGAGAGAGMGPAAGQWGMGPAAGQGGMGPAAMPGQHFDGGAPPPGLVQEVEAALNRIGASAMATPGANESLNAGAAPV